MPDPPSQQAYLELAGKLFDGQITESDLPTAVPHLHPLDEEVAWEQVQWFAKEELPIWASFTCLGMP